MLTTRLDLVGVLAQRGDSNAALAPIEVSLEAVGDPSVGEELRQSIAGRAALLFEPRGDAERAVAFVAPAGSP